MQNERQTKSKNSNENTNNFHKNQGSGYFWDNKRAIISR